MQGKLNMFTQSYWFPGCQAENLKHMTSVHTMRELFRTKVMILEENVEMLSRVPAQSRFLPTCQPEIVHKQSLLIRVFSQEQISAKVSRRRWPICSLIANKKNCHEIKMPAPWKKSYNKARQCIKKQRHHFSDKGPYRQSYGFASSHVWIWDLHLDHNLNLHRSLSLRSCVVFWGLSRV